MDILAGSHPFQGLVMDISKSSPNTTLKSRTLYAVFSLYIANFVFQLLTIWSGPHIASFTDHPIVDGNYFESGRITRALILGVFFGIFNNYVFVFIVFLIFSIAVFITFINFSRSKKSRLIGVTFSALAGISANFLFYLVFLGTGVSKDLIFSDLLLGLTEGTITFFVTGLVVWLLGEFFFKTDSSNEEDVRAQV